MVHTEKVIGMVKWISFKLMFERAKMYMASANFIMIAVLFVQQTDFDPLTVVLLSVSSLLILTIIDFKWIYPNELGRTSEKNPFLVGIKNDISRLLQITERLVDESKSLTENDKRMLKEQISKLEEKGR
jgi:hypothetical protein